VSVRPSRATPEPVNPQHISAFTRLRGLLEVTRLVRTDDELDHLLAAVARTTAESLGFGTVVLNIYRPAWDDFCTTTVHGSEAARDLLLGDARGWDVWGRVLADGFLYRGAYFVPHGTFDWDELAPRSYVPELPRTSVPGAWHPEDSLMVPMRHTDGHLLGIMSVDEPISGRRPSDDEVDVLVALAAHAALAIQSAQEMAEAARHRSALEQLLRVSSQLTETVTVGAVLQAVCDGIHTALGFETVCVDLPNPDNGRLEPAAAYGWELDDPAVNSSYSMEQIRTLLAPEYESQGCYVIPDEKAVALIRDDPGPYRSRLNGQGPHAWRDHWLIVPLYGRGGEVIGLIWTDDPVDRLLPSPERLQALRVFANQATTALDTAAQFEEMQFLADHDPLTRLLNRRSFVRHLALETSRAARYDRPFTLLVGDLNGFKKLNDRLGHQAGDDALEALGQVLMAGRREVDGVYRIGGDEFALLLPEVGEEEGHAVIERIGEALRSGHEVLESLTISFGLAVCPRDGTDPESLFRAADESMYGAKRQPGGRLPFAS
jgi:diguanylate cyclase (GGDEF)-like protein